MVYRVFLSSTSQDLVTEREAVLAAIAGLDGFTPIAMDSSRIAPSTTVTAENGRARSWRGPSRSVHAIAVARTRSGMDVAIGCRRSAGEARHAAADIAVRSHLA